MSKETFNDKIVVVTGAASGIGLAICRRFSRDGARIAMLDVDEPALRAVESEMAGLGVDCLGVRCDVSRQEESTAAIRQIIDHYGGIDVLVNNAGITQRGPFVDTDLSV